MNAPANEPAAAAEPTAQQMFLEEGLPFPPVPAALAASLKRQGPAWFATRPAGSTPYDLEHFLAETESPADPAEYAVVGFDGHGTNSWAVHFYLVVEGLALFMQLPWGGIYLEREPARQDIAELFDWAGALQARVRQAVSEGKIPRGLRLQVAASRFGHAGWRWLGAGQAPWQPSGGMKATLLQELDQVIGGQRVLEPASAP